ncbi:MAG: GlsB/YeaQ/YmgE family stress response membrane protein [Caulobacter sp.]|nr:GlsB/YeaQ/YmgE family stress response membrane protein [Caulobacter sp.]
MSGVGVFVAVVIGILAGWVADLVLARRHALFTKLLIGVVGSFIGTFIAQRLEFRFDGFLGSLLVSSVGAIFFLAVLGIVSSIFRRPA